MDNQPLLLLLFFLTLVTTASFAQDQPMENEVENIKAKGRKAIIQLAYDLLGEKRPDLKILPEDYEITVWANRMQVLVKFRRLIRYASPNRHYSYDLKVDVVTNRISPFDDWHFDDKFFVPTKEQKEVIDYLKDLLGLPFPHMKNEISENDEYFIVSCTSKTGFSHHYIDKKTGERLEPLEGTFAVFPEKFESPIIVLGGEAGESIFSNPIQNEEDSLKEIKD